LIVECSVAVHVTQGLVSGSLGLHLDAFVAIVLVVFECLLDGVRRLALAFEVVGMVLL